MSKLNLGILLLFLVAACGGSSSSLSNAPTSPTTPSSPATPVSQNGCSATFACPNADNNGTPNPTTPTFDSLTLSNGTSSTCPVSLPPPNIGKNMPPKEFPIEFTIRNPQTGFSWRNHSDLNLGNNRVGTDPISGSAAAAGPVQVNAFFGVVGTNKTFTQNLTLQIVDTPNPFSGATEVGNVVATCGVTLWGIFQ